MGGTRKVSADPLVGTMIADRYRIVERIARGGMGQIYKAQQIPLDREVAVKVLDVGRQAQDESILNDFKRRFVLEAAALAKLNHPNTIVIYDYGTLGDDRYYIAMELLRGKTLRELVVGKGPLDPEEAIHVGIQMSASLTEAHEQGLIHRDLKPANIFLTHRGDDHRFVKVLDFGLVKRDQNTAMDYSTSGNMVGTPRYMAPEQIIGTSVYPETDIYGVGATLYYALTGLHPVDGENQFEIMIATTEKMPRPFDEARPNFPIPSDLEQVIFRCLRKDPKERYNTMRELTVALFECSNEVSSNPYISSRPRGPKIPSDYPAAPGAPTQPAKRSADPVEPPAEAPAESEAQPPTRRWWLWVVAAAALTLLAGAGAFVVGSLTDSDTPTIDTSASTISADPPAEPTDEDDSQPAGPAVPEAPGDEAAEESQQDAEPPATFVRLTSSPEHTIVSRDGADLGDTPISLRIPPDEQWEVTLRAPGYHSRQLLITPDQAEVHIALRRVASSSRRSTAPAPPRTDNRDPWAE